MQFSSSGALLLLHHPVHGLHELDQVLARLSPSDGTVHERSIVRVDHIFRFIDLFRDGKPVLSRMEKRVVMAEKQGFSFGDLQTLVPGTVKLEL